MKGHLLFFLCFIFLIGFTIRLYLFERNARIRSDYYEQQIRDCDRRLTELDDSFRMLMDPDWETKWEHYLLQEMSIYQPV